LCIHAANCIRQLPGVFDPNARPWVSVDAAGADDVASAIRTCPTGALRYRRTDGAPQEMPDVPTTVQQLRNGPLIVRGDIRVVDADGNVVRPVTRVVLCRCGRSQNKPYCDLSRLSAGFEAD
jgi:ferredoxin